MVIFVSLPNMAYELKCPQCKNMHQWKPSDAWVEQTEKLPLDAA